MFNCLFNGLTFYNTLDAKGFSTLVKASTGFYTTYRAIPCCPPQAVKNLWYPGYCYNGNSPHVLAFI